MPEEFSLLILSLLAYGVGAGAPGPSTLLISNTSMARGRRNGLALAAGVVTGSVFWGLLAAGGFAYVLSTYGPLAEALRIAAALYFFYLAIRSARSALKNEPATTKPASSGELFSDFQRGLLLHLTNPKAVLVWLATISIGLPQDGGGASPFVIVASCGVLGAFIFGAYAIAFSTEPAQRWYRSTKRWIESAGAAIFGTAGILLLIKRGG